MHVFMTQSLNAMSQKRFMSLSNIYHWFLACWILCLILTNLQTVRRLTLFNTTLLICNSSTRYEFDLNFELLVISYCQTSSSFKSLQKIIIFMSLETFLNLRNYLFIHRMTSIKSCRSGWFLTRWHISSCITWLWYRRDDQETVYWSGES